MINILIIDNYDSFTYNLDQLFGKLPNVKTHVIRNDADFISGIEEGVYDGVVIGPGPGTPLDSLYFGKNMQVINKFGVQGLPILGVCLGFQGIGVAFGASIKQAVLPQHGKVSSLYINKENLLIGKQFTGLEVMRYHSLMIDMDKPFPNELEIFAEIEPSSMTVQRNGREVMGIRHKTYPIYGLQFHPESYASTGGYHANSGIGDAIAKNFVNIINEN